MVANIFLGILVSISENKSPTWNFHDFQTGKFVVLVSSDRPIFLPNKNPANLVRIELKISFLPTLLIKY